MVDSPGVAHVTPRGRAVGVRRWGIAAALVALSAVAAPSAQSSGAALPRRLIVGLDGVGYAEMHAVQDAGAFARFLPVSRLISTFPSISDIAWSEIFQTGPPRGYQRVYVDLDSGRLVGGGLDPIRPIEFERRMHLGFEAMTHHVSSYVTPGRAARGELARLERAVLESRGVETFFAYLPAPDALQHVRGDVTRYLWALDATLTRLSATYEAHTGVPLEIVLLSDHGHNGVRDARRLDLTGHLRAHGYRTARRITADGDVVFSTDGVSTGVGVFSAPAAAPRLAAVLATAAGVELVTWIEPDWPGRVAVRDGRGQIAHIERRADGALAYVCDYGDPLGYAPVAAALAAEGQLEPGGFALPAAWLHASVGHQYPAALQRIVRGHHDVTRNPAPILLSIADGYQVANGMVATLNRLRPLGGTHGSLNDRNSVGIVMSTFQPTVDATTDRVAAQFGGFHLARTLSTH